MLGHFFGSTGAVAMHGRRSYSLPASCVHVKPPMTTRTKRSQTQITPTHQFDQSNQRCSLAMRTAAPASTAAEFVQPKMATARNAVYWSALGSNGSAGAAPAPPSTGAAAYNDSFIIQKGNLSALPPGVSRIVDGTRKLFEVRTMQEHCDLMRSLLVRDVAYQAPIIAAYDRENFRVAAYLAKSIAYMSMEPHMVEVSPAGYNLTTVKVDSTVFVSPKRSWLLPPSLLLPDIPIRATIKLGVRGPLESGMIEFLDGRWHNLPSAPGLICRVNGFLMGRVMRWFEPLWPHGLWLVGDNSYSNSSHSRNDKVY